MKSFYIIGFLALMAFDTLAQVSFKYTGLATAPESFDLAWVFEVLRTPWTYGAVCGYLGSFVAWITLLRRAPIGPAFAASHLELVSVTILSIWLFNEPLNAWKISGGMLIVLGVLCLAKSEEPETH